MCNKIGNNFLQPYCLNNGICYKSKKKGNAKIDDDDIFCQCGSEYTGKRCETKTSMLINTMNGQVMFLFLFR